MNRTATRIFWIFGIGILVVAGFYYSTRSTPLLVKVHRVGKGLVEATVANTRAGTVKACRRAKLAPQIGGQVAQLPIEKGDRVEEGALLLELWNDDLQQALRLARSEVKAARARTEQSCLAADLAAREAVRFEQLSKEGVVDDSGLDRAQSERETTRADCRAATATQEEARAQVKVTQAELDKTILRAPFEGVVAELNAELGEMVIPSPPGIPTPPAVDLIETGCLYVVAPIDEVDAPHVEVGQRARITLDAFPAEVFEGTVRRVAPYVLDREKQARTLDVEVDILDPEALSTLVPGYSADVEVLLEDKSDALRVPSEVVIAGERVLVLEGDHLEERTFVGGLFNWEFTEVISGISEGENVVLSLDREGVMAGAKAEIEPE